MQGQEYEVLVVDTAGQDEYSIFPTQYSVDIDGYVMVYSIDNLKSFEVVQVRRGTLMVLVLPICLWSSWCWWGWCSWWCWCSW